MFCSQTTFSHTLQKHSVLYYPRHILGPQLLGEFKTSNIYNNKAFSYRYYPR